MHFMTALTAAWQQRNSLLCVGLDPDPARFPAHLQGRQDAIFEFCKAIVDATADLVCCFKPQIAYFAARGAEDQLEALIEQVIAELGATSKKQMGQVMGALGKATGGNFDKPAAAKIVGGKLA